MEECKNCSHYIPDDIEVCPHCKVMKRTLLNKRKFERFKDYKEHIDHDFSNSCYCIICGKLNTHTWNGYKCMCCGVFHPDFAKFLPEIKKFNYPIKNDTRDERIIEMAKKHFPWGKAGLSLRVNELSREEHCSGEPIYAMWETITEEFFAVLYIDGKESDHVSLGKAYKNHGYNTGGSNYNIIE